MDGLRHGVSLRAYGQRDPLVEYKREAYHMFQHLVSGIKTEIATNIFRASVQVHRPDDLTRMNVRRQQAQHADVQLLSQMAAQAAMSQSTANSASSFTTTNAGGRPANEELTAAAAQGMDAVLQKMRALEQSRNQPPQLPKGVPIRNEAPSAGRNDPCPCGSGKKYKKCCGAAQGGGGYNKDER